jgi:hypothetical protein
MLRAFTDGQQVPKLIFTESSLELSGFRGKQKVVVKPEMGCYRENTWFFHPGHGLPSWVPPDSQKSASAFYLCPKTEGYIMGFIKKSGHKFTARSPEPPFSLPKIPTPRII